MRKINKGDWIVITTKDPNVKDVVTEMKKLDGVVLQLPGHDNCSFNMTKESGVWKWSSENNQFRLAEPHEIPGYINPEPNYEIY